MRLDFETLAKLAHEHGPAFYLIDVDRFRANLRPRRLRHRLPRGLEQPGIALPQPLERRLSCRTAQAARVPPHRLELRNDLLERRRKRRIRAASQRSEPRDGTIEVRRQRAARPSRRLLLVRRESEIGAPTMAADVAPARQQVMRNPESYNLHRLP